MPAAARSRSSSSCVAGVALAFRGRLHLDQTAVAAHDDVEVDLGTRVLRVVEVEERLAVDDPERDARDRVGQCLPEAEAVERPARRDVGTGDRSAPCAAVCLEHVTVDPERALAERVQVGHRAERPPDQALDLHRAPFLPARARLARGALARRRGQQPVLRSHPAFALAHQPARHAFGDRRRAENAGLPRGDQGRAGRLLEVVDLDLQRPQLIRSAPVRPHAAAASSSAISTRSTPSSGSWRKRWPSSLNRSVSPVVRNR